MSILLGAGLSLLVGGITTLIYAWLVWWLDHYEKEPWWLLALAFFWGAIPAVVLSIALEVAFDIPISVLGPGLAYEVMSNSLLAPAIEEVAKGVFVFGIVLFVGREMDSLLDGIVYGAMVGLGFAFTENILYFVGGLQRGGWGVWATTVVMRAIVFGLNHAFFSAITGGALVYAFLNPDPIAKVFIPILGLGAATLFHSIHNSGAMLSSVTWFGLLLSVLFDWAGVLMVGLAVGLAWQQEKQWIKTHLQPEVGSTLPREVYELAASYRRRLGVQAQALLRGDIRAWSLNRRMAQTATDLAFKKHQLATLGNEMDTQQMVEDLREQLASLQGY